MPSILADSIMEATIPALSSASPMSVISAVLLGSPTVPLLKSLSQAVGGGVMGLRRDWMAGEPIHVAMVPGPDWEYLVTELMGLIAWADREAIRIDIYETDTMLPPPGSRPEPIPRQDFLDIVETAYLAERQVREEDRDMSVISVILAGTPTTPLLKSLSLAIGGGVMDLRADWIEGEAMVWVEILGPDFDDQVSQLKALLAWADANGVEVALYDHSVPVSRDTKVEPVRRENVLNRIQRASDLLAEQDPERP